MSESTPAPDDEAKTTDRSGIPGGSSGAELRQRAETAFQARTAKFPETREAPTPEATQTILHELRVHQIELEMQNEELRRAQVELDATRARYFDLYDLAPVGYVTVSEPGLILESNLTAASLLRVARGVLIKQRLTQFILKDDQDIYYRHRKQLLVTGEPQACDLRMVKSDGTPLWTHLTVTAAQDESGAPVCRIVMTDITERERAAEALRESNKRLEEISFCLADWVWEVDEKGVYTYSSQHGFGLFGSTANDVIGRTPFDFMPPDEANRMRAIFADIAARKAPIKDLENWNITNNGERICLITNGVPIFDEAGKFRGYRGVDKDITVRKQAEAELAQAHDLLANLARLVPGVVYQYRLYPDGRSAFPYASPGMNDIYEVTPEEVKHDATPVFGRLHPDDYERVGSAIHESARTLQTFYCTFRVILPRQGLRWRWSQAQPERTEDGGTLWHGIISDITELKKAEMALATTAELLEQTGAIAKVGGWELDLRTMKLFWSLETCRIHEVDPPVAPALDHAIDFYAPAARPIIQAAVQAATERGTPYDLELQLISAKGRSLWVRAQCSPVMEDGKVTKLLGAFHDITERKQTEARLRKQVTLLDSASDAIYVRALDHTVSYWNEGAARLYGWSAAEAVGRKLTELGLVEPVGFATAHTALLAQGNWSGEVHKTGKDGKERVVFSRWTLLRDEQGQPTEILAINTDITDKKQLESRYLRAQRMEGIGMLAGGLAHDLNNILTPILMSAPLLRGAVRDADDLAIIDSVENSARRGADIIRQLLTFARGQPGVRAPILVRQLLREMEKLIRETFPRNLRVAVSVPPELWPVLGDATQIHQALMNLCVNARDAMPDGGALTLAADNATLDATSAAQIPDAKPGPHVRMWVRDTGTGISPKQLEHIFDPFFTTKEIGKGTGLGLPTVLGIVRGHGGSVRVVSCVGQGSTFELYLPASPETAAAANPPQRESRLPRGHGELILVVDDEAAVRGSAQYVLEKYGYRVLTAAEGGEALKLFDRHRSEIKAVLADMMMPGMDGPKLVRALRQQDPRLPILGMTGLVERGTFKGLEGLDAVPLLAKPFELEGLLVALHQTLTTGIPTTGSAE